MSPISSSQGQLSWLCPILWLHVSYQHVNAILDSYLLPRPTSTALLPFTISRVRSLESWKKNIRNVSYCEKGFNVANHAHACGHENGFCNTTVGKGIECRRKHLEPLQVHCRRWLKKILEFPGQWTQALHAPRKVLSDKATLRNYRSWHTSELCRNQRKRHS